MDFRDRILGWANLTLTKGNLGASFGFVTGSAPRDRVFKRELEAELARMRAFLGGTSHRDPERAKAR